MTPPKLFPKRSVNKFLPLVAAIVVLSGCGNDESARQPFPVADFTGREVNFIGNRYQLNGQIESQLHWDAQKGRLLVLQPQNVQAAPMVVFLPASLEQSVHVGQRYRLNVQIVEGGLVRIESMRKF